MAYTNIIVVRYDSFGNIIYQSPNTLNAGSIGQGLLRVQAPFDNTTYTGAMTWTLANGQSVAQTFDTVAQVTIEEILYYQWDKPIDDTITVVSANNSTVDLLNTPTFTSSEQVLSMEQASIPVTAGDVSQLSPIPPDEGAVLSANKRDRDSSNLDDADLDATQTITTWNGTAEKITTVDKIVERASGQTTVDLIPTNVDSTRDDIALGVKFRKNVDNTLDPDYVTAGGEITLSTTVADSFENVYSFIAYDGFLSGERSDINFTTTLEAKKKTGNVGSVDFKLEYKKLEANDTESMIFDGLPITVATDDFNTSTKGGKIVSSDIDYDLGEAFITRLYLKSSTIGDGVTFKVGGTNPASFTTFFVSASSVNTNKIDKMVGAVGGKLVESKTDGQITETSIDASDVELISNRGVSNGTASLDGTARIPVEQLPLTVVNSLGTFGSGGSTTGGDLPSTATQGDQYTCDTADYVSVEAELTFQLNDKAQYDVSGNWKRIASTDSVTSVNSKTGDVVLDKSDIGLNLVDNTADLDKPISTDTQTALDAKLGSFQFLVDGVPVGANEFDTINIASGGSATQDGTDPRQVNLDVFGAGTGEGTIVLGQASTVVPLVAPTVETLISWDTQADGQSTDLTVMELFDKDESPANTVRVYKTKTELNDLPVQYKYFLQGIGTNTNTGTSVDLDFTLKKDGVIQWVRTKTIGEAKPAPGATDTTNNFVVEEYVTTDPLEVSEDLQLFITASDAGVTLDALEIHVTSNFVSGEALSNIMRTDVYDLGKLGRVDKAFADDVGNEIKATYATQTVVDLNTTHRTSDGKDHSDVVTNTTSIGVLVGSVSGLETDVGKLQNPDIDEKTASFTLALEDDGQVLKVNSASAVVVTVPLNATIAFPIGTQIALYRNGTGTVTLLATGGVTINSVDSNLAIKGQYGSCALLKTGTDEWLLVGSLEA
ncbi:minor tail protein [PinkBerry-associated phage LS06-2018-MD08]|nr:minor tail protein [PinkBerry-associated phage LS06-2018-MD08]